MSIKFQTKQAFSAAADDNLTGATESLENNIGVGVVCTVSGTGTVAGSFNLEFSNDGVAWVTGDTEAFTGNGSKALFYTDAFFRYFRITWVDGGSAATATAAAVWCIKGV